MIRVAAYWNDRRKELLPHEQGCIYKVDVDVTIALCFPNSYAVGMSNLGFHTAYWYFNLPENVKAERAFFEQNAQPLTLESGRPLSAFPLVGFSVNFELDYLNFLRMIHLSRIPVFRSQRTENHPLIFIGGFMTYFNIRPLVPFIDFACMGDSEELFMHVNAVLIQSVQEGWKREELLKRLARIDGIFVPQFSEKATPQIIEDLNTFETVSRIISPHTEFKNMFLIEIVRGCFHQCNFCIAGHAYGPPRVRDVTHVIASCEKGLRMTNRLGFIASAPSDYPDIDALCHFLDKKGARISFSSLRASSITKSVLSLLAKSHQTSLTLAPETGSERLRYFINKKIPNEKFFHVIESAKEVGMKKIKLYMMFGLPRENDDDLKETVSFIKHVSRILPVRISMTPFIPKPHTPFAVYKIENKNIIRKKISFFRNALGRNKRVMIVFDGIKSAHRQSVFAQGNETVLLDEVEGLPATV